MPAADAWRAPSTRDAPPRAAERAAEPPLSRRRTAHAQVSAVERADEVDGYGRPWHAIYWASGKRYAYRLYCGDFAMDPMQRLYRHHAHVKGFRGGLDVGLMEEVDC